MRGGRKARRIERARPFLSLFLSFFLSTHLAYFPVAADDFWALSSCWQHPVYKVIHTYSTVKRARTHTCRSSHLLLAPVGSAPFTDVQFTAHSLLLLASAMPLLWRGFRLLSKSRHTKPCSHPALLLHLACALIPGQTTTTAFTVAFDGAALSFTLSVRAFKAGNCTVEARHGLCFEKLACSPLQGR